MADGFLIGSAFVRVTADMDGFEQSVQAGADKATAKVSVPVSPDTSDFAAKLRAAVDAAGLPSESVRIGADLTGLDAGVADADAKLDEVGARRVLASLGLDSGTFAAAMADAMARLDEAGARSVTARLTLDDSGFKAKLDADMAELAAASSEGGGGGGVGLLGAGIGAGVLGGAALPGALAGAGGAVGTLGLAFAGISSAMQAYDTQAASAAKATQGVGSSATQASQQVRSAQQAVSDAETQSAHDAITSAESIKNAQAGVASAVTAAAQSQAAAEQQLQTAQYNEQQAQEALTAARAAAVLQLQQLDDAEQDTALSAQQAALDLQQAQLNQQQTDASATSTALQKAQAELSVEEAEQRLKEALQARTNAATAATTADKEGVEGSPGVVAAKHNVASAEQAQAAAATNLAQVEQAGAASIAKAQQGLADAERSASWQRAADAEHVQDAQQGLAAAYASAAGGSAAAAAAGNGYAEAMAKLTPASQQVVRDLISLKSSLTDLESVSVNAIAPGLAVFLHGVQSLLPEVSKEITAMGGIISSGLDAAGREIASSGFQKDLAGIFDEGNQFIQVIGPALGNVAGAFVDLGARGGPAVAGLGAGLAGLADGVADLLRGLAPFSSQAGEILAVLGQAAGLLGGPLAQAAGLAETAIAPLVQVALPAFASLVRSLSQVLAALLPGVTDAARDISDVLGVAMSAAASAVGAAASAVDGLISVLGPDRTGEVIAGITAIVAGMKAWGAATAALEGEGLIGTVASWATSMGEVVTASTAAAGAQKLLAASSADVLFTAGNFTVTAAGEVVATEAATAAMGELTVAETAAAVAGGLLEAISPVGWAIAGAAAIAGLTMLLLSGGDAIDQYVARQRQATDATGYNIAGYDKLGEQLSVTGNNQAKLNSVVQASVNPLVSAHDGINEYASGMAALNTQSEQAFTTGDKLTDAMNGLASTYGITEASAIKVAEAAGISSTAWTGSASAIDKANAKFAAYIINNQAGLPAQQEENALMSIFGDNAQTAATQISALNTNYQILAGNFISNQQALLNADTAVQGFGQAVKTSGANSTAAQTAFYAGAASIKAMADNFASTHVPMSTMYQDIESHIRALQQAGPLNAAETTALQGMKEWADQLANSVHGMTGAQQQAATYMENQMIPQLTDLGVQAGTAKTDTKNLADAIVNTGTQSEATKADRAQLIKDLEDSGVNAQTATGLVDSYIKKIDGIPKSATTTIGVSGTGQWSISEVIPTTGLPLPTPLPPPNKAGGGLIRGPGSETSDSIPARLSDHEFVMQAAAVHKYGTGLMDSINTMKFAGGGFAGTPAAAAAWIAGQDSNLDATMKHDTESDIAKAIAAAIAAAKASSAGGGPGEPGPGGGAPAANAALAKKLYPAWATGAEWTAWNNVAMRESGWNQFAQNASSGAYGIPQALPASKMGAAANPPESNPTAQINWMIGYIKGRYGDPEGAWDHELSAGWYDNGGWLQPGTTVARNDTGKPERVLPPGQEPQVVHHHHNSFNLSFSGQRPTEEEYQAIMMKMGGAVRMSG